MDENLIEVLEEIKKELRAIRSTIQQLPEVNAGVFLTLYDEYCSAKLRGLKVSDIWDVKMPSQQQDLGSS